MSGPGFIHDKSEAKPSAVSERRRSSRMRRDINALLRGKDGEISGSKIATYAGQIIAGRLLLTNALPTWDVLAILFLVLIAPEAYKQMMAMKWGGNAGAFTERTERTRESTSTTKGPT
jgi:hypothetical protein